MREKKNPWWPLFITNFLSVFNDNLIKFLVIFVGISWVSGDNQSTVISVASAMLVLPFISARDCYCSMLIYQALTTRFKTRMFDGRFQKTYDDDAQWLARATRPLGRR